MLCQDAAVVEELKATVEGVDSVEKATAVLIDFAKNKGFDFTAEDIAEFETEAQKELSLEELEQINAGVWGVCFIFGIGMDEASGCGSTVCRVLGIGMGVGWKDPPKSIYDQEFQTDHRIPEVGVYN